MNCSGAHRALGPNNTRVKSTQLDTFQPEWVRLLRLGNTVCNQFWEHSIGDRKLVIWLKQEARTGVIFGRSP